ncbi:LytTR family DNA-binding domain-containing protein [Porifericola rhodea]|uniref:LytR/AlgR family response regulator transcription factor n=1 Tax=Porifericola rhodea TaxID=930972 RepID=UPI00266542A5|nr:LytTR family DNA-binding domain-containing protein [Porifericola rhodea]WKN29849.1 LytTR family DNA-binding domain-containing protein [Porifericola rhodea]
MKKITIRYLVLSTVSILLFVVLLYSLGVDVPSFFQMIFSFLRFLLPFFLGGFAIYFGFRLLKSSSPAYDKANNKSGAETSILKIAVRSGDKILLLPLDRIASFYALHNYVYAYTDEGNEYLVEHTLSQLEAKLPRNFLRVHRSSIVNEDYIKSIEREKGGKHSITLNDQKNKSIQVSQSYGQTVKKLTEL